MTDNRKGIFLSYASQDADAARRICDALRAAGLEVWFDQSELRGGDAWDTKIRQQIRECSLFVPLISANTDARPEGYFRLEWKLAVDRTHLMADNVPFLFPVVIDASTGAMANVPEKFRERQWTHLVDGRGDAAFAKRVAQVISGAESNASIAKPLLTARTIAPAPKTKTRAWLALSLAGIAVFSLVALRQYWLPATGLVSASAKESAAATAIAKIRELLDDDPLMTRRNVELAEQLALDAITKYPDNAEAAAALSWVNFRYLESSYEDTPKRRADLRNYAEKAKLLAPDSINAELAMGGLLVVNRNWDEANRRMDALAERAPKNIAVLRTALAAATQSSGGMASPAKVDTSVALGRLRAASVVGKAHADTRTAAELWRKGEYVEADRLLDRVFAEGYPPTTAFLVRLLVLAYGWGDLDGARRFAATIPAKLLLEDVFIYHLSTVEMQSGEYDKALEILSRTQRDILKEAFIELPAARQRGDVLAAAGRPSAAAIQWREALKLVDQQLTARPDRSELHSQRALLLANLGETKAARAAQDLSLEMRGNPAKGSIDWGRQFRFFAAIGDVEGALMRIDRLVARDHGRWPTVYNALRHEPGLRSLLKDPRSKAITDRGERWLAEMRATGGS